MVNTTCSVSTAEVRIVKVINPSEWQEGGVIPNSNDCCYSGVYCLQYDDNKIVSGLRDNTIKMWDRQTLQQYSKVLTGHTGSVLCLQYDDKVGTVYLTCFEFDRSIYKTITNGTIKK